MSVVLETARGSVHATAAGLSVISDDPGAANRLPPLGWPWDQLADAVLRWDDARRRHHAAQVAGDPRAREAAAHEMDLALADRGAIRSEAASQFLFGLRSAIEEQPTALAALLGRAVPPSDAVAEAITELEDRVDAAEDAVVNLEQDRVCR